MLNMGEKPIAYKYCEGKMKRTLKRELKGLEIAMKDVDAIGICSEIWVHEVRSLPNTARVV